MQVISAVCMAVGVCIYPLGWDSPLIRAICGASASRYNPGACAIRWAIPLAAIAALDAATLAALAFILASRHVRLQPETFNNGSLYKGEVNPGYMNEAQSMAGSRKSLSLRPVLLVAPPEQDRYSELSRAKSHSHHSLYSPAPSHPVHTMSTNTLSHSQHNFQLWRAKRGVEIIWPWIPKALVFTYMCARNEHVPCHSYFKEEGPSAWPCVFYRRQSLNLHKGDSYLPGTSCTSYDLRIPISININVIYIVYVMTNQLYHVITIM